MNCNINLQLNRSKEIFKNAFKHLFLLVNSVRDFLSLTLSVKYLEKFISIRIMKDTDESVAICSNCFEPITSEIYHPVDCFLFDVILPKGKSYKFALPRRVPSEPRDITTHLIVWEKKQKRISNICPKCYIKQIMVRYLVTRESKRHIEENELGNRHSGKFFFGFF